MYIERKAGAVIGTARIGRVTFNRTGRSIHYRGQIFRRIVGGGFKQWPAPPEVNAAIRERFE
jgi:hypothetical protein